MLYKSNIMALVGGGANPKFAINKVVLWDDYLGQVSGEITIGSGTIKSVNLRQNKLLILTEKKIYIHNLQDLALIKAISTGENIRGLFAFSLNESILCYPSNEDVGEIKFFNLENNLIYGSKAHSNRIWLMEMNHAGDQIATVSEKGTIIRLFNVKDGSLLRELRRGTEHHLILSVQFSMNSAWLLCTSDSGTTHVFSIGKEENSEEDAIKDMKKNNKKSKLSFLRVVHHYFDSEWSYSQFRLPDKNAKIVFVPQQKQIIALSPKGQYYIVSYDQAAQGKVLHTKSFSSRLF